MFCSRWVCRSSVRARRFVSHSANGQPPTKSSGPGTRCEKFSIVWRREKVPMPLLRQLEFGFGSTAVAGIGDPGRLGAFQDTGVTDPGYNNVDRNLDLEETARELLRALGAARIAAQFCVEWNSRLKTAAGRA